MKIFVDPRNRFVYSSFYLEGLHSVYGKGNLIYSKKPFTELHREIDRKSYDHYMAYTIENEGQTYRVIIDFRDSTDITEYAYNWADVYGKINVDAECNLKQYRKLIVLPPSFAIKVWSIPTTVWYCFYNYFASRCHPLTGIKGHLHDYFGLLIRNSLGNYSKKSEVDENYVFHASTFWRHPNCLDQVNPLRALFIRTCKETDSLKFEGGFVRKRTDHLDIPQEYKDLLATKRFTADEYLANTRRSLFVFNTPAVHNCLGWKLGEYLALGKAIITTPISNQLSHPLVIGKHLLVVTDKEDLAATIENLSHNMELRHTLEINARSYFENYCTPIKVIQNIHGRLALLRNSK